MFDINIKISKMTEKEEKETIKQIKKYFTKIFSTEESSLAFFVSLGSHDKNGKLTKNYK